MKNILLIFVMIACVSCNNHSGLHEGCCDTRKAMYNSYVNIKQKDLEGIKITKFAHIGNVVVNSRNYYVVDMNAVIEGMLAPRGISNILIFDTNYNLVETIHSCKTPPLWCEGSNIYLWGAVTQEGMYGNVWEFKDGIEEGKRKLIEVPAYGSFEPDEELSNGTEQ